MGKIREIIAKEICRLTVFDIKKIYEQIEKGGDDRQEHTVSELGDVMQPYREKRYFDILLASYLLNPLKNDYEVENIAGEYLGLTIPDRMQVCGKASYAEAYAARPKEVMEYA
ncbi:MAG: hypothetical protein K2N77_13875, partial [Lachnospiraceae bacterium]|nr:hypothetical protein [Lachnospiraceae bacterium]